MLPCPALSFPGHRLDPVELLASNPLQLQPVQLVAGQAVQERQHPAQVRRRLVPEGLGERPGGFVGGRRRRGLDCSLRGFGPDWPPAESDGQFRELQRCQSSGFPHLDIDRSGQLRRIGL